VRNTVLAIIVMLIAGQWASAQVLKQVPSDAMVVLKVNNIKQVSDKVAQFGQDLALNQFVPWMADPLGALQTETKMQQGLDTAGEMAFVFIDPGPNGDPGESMLILVPVTDYKAFLGNWPAAQTEGGITQVQMGSDPSPGFVAEWGKYAAIAPKRELVAKTPTDGITLPPATAKEMANKDAMVYANFTVIRARALPALAEFRQAMLPQIDRGIRSSPEGAKMAPVVMTIFGQMLNLAERFLNDTQAATVGTMLLPEGTTFTAMAEYQTDSYLGKLASSMKNSDAPLLVGLPEAKYLFYGGAVNDPQVANQIITDVGDQILKDLLAIGPEMAPAQDYFDALKAAVMATKGQSFGVVAPSGAIGVEPLIQFLSVSTGDVPTMKASTTKMVNSQIAVMKSMAVPGMAAMKSTHAEGAKTIDGVTFDSMATTFDAAAGGGRGAMQQQQMMNMLYGPQGQIMYYGAVGDDKLLATMGLNDEFMGKAVAAARANAMSLAQDANVKAVAAQLPKQRMAVVYVGVGDIVTAALNVARQMGMAMPLQLPPNLPPVGVTFGAEGSAMRVDAHVPKSLVQSLVAAGMQAQMQMQGGAGGGL
jgi:hypothetical protein